MNVVRRLLLVINTLFFVLVLIVLIAISYEETRQTYNLLTDSEYEELGIDASYLKSSFIDYKVKARSVENYIEENNLDYIVGFYKYDENKVGLWRKNEQHIGTISSKSSQPIMFLWYILLSTLGTLLAWYIIYQTIFYITTGKLNRDILIKKLTN